MKAWLWYAAVGLLVTVAVGGIVTLVVAPAARSAVWFAAALAYTLQLATFAALVAVRSRGEWFLAGWLGGMVVRFGAVGVVAWWLARSEALPRAPALLSLVGFLFVLLLMEPVFLRRGVQTR